MTTLKTANSHTLTGSSAWCVHGDNTEPVKFLLGRTRDDTCQAYSMGVLNFEPDGYIAYLQK